MKYTTELYLKNKHITKNEWRDLIKTISNYNGVLKSWKIIITNNKNQIRYFLLTNCNLPPTINNLNSFLLKQEKNFQIQKTNYNLIFINKIENNLIDIINYFEIKKISTLTYLEINFTKLTDKKIISTTNIYVKNKKRIIKYKVLLSIPTNILSIDFEGNKRYFYKSIPKYLDINKILHLLNSDSSNSLLKIETFPYLQENYFLTQTNYDFDKHSIIFGSSGSGKSKFISLLIKNIYNNIELKTKYKIIVIDPHAALEKDIGGIAKTIDFKTIEDTIDLFINKNEDIISSTELLLDLLKSLISTQYNSKLERLLRHSIYLLLSNESFNFTNLRKLLLDIEYRNFTIKTQQNNIPNSIIDFFLTDFNDLKTKSYGETISPIISFIDEMQMLPVFNNKNDCENLKNTLSNNFLTLISLDRTKLGEKIIKAISGLIMQQLLTLIQSHQINEHIIFIIDEVAIIENPILSKFLAEARKYNLSLILAGQYFNQITEELKNSIFANVINYYIFRISKLDANLLVNNFNMKIPIDDSIDSKTKILTELNNRECIVRISSNGILLPGFKAKTLDYISIPRIIKQNSINNLITKEETKNKKKFEINNTLNLKDILISNSSSRKEINNDRY